MPFNLAELFLFPFFLVFIRMGAALLIFPGFSDPSINPRARLMAALGISLALWPLVQPQLPALPSQAYLLLSFILIEMAIGLMMGVAARLMMSAMSVAGEMIAFATGFQAATLFDPATNSNTSAPTLFLLLCAGVLIFATNTHHLLIDGIVSSYTLFPPGELPPLSDAAQAAIQVIQNLFVLGLKLGAPVVVVGFLTYVAFGIFNRLIPSLHVFFVALPLSIAIGLIVLAASLGMMFTVFITELQNNMFLFDIPLTTG